MAVIPVLASVLENKAQESSTVSKVGKLAWVNIVGKLAWDNKVGKLAWVNKVGKLAWVNKVGNLAWVNNNAGFEESRSALNFHLRIDNSINYYWLKPAGSQTTLLNMKRQ